ncbi:four-carbon acid sugar kinase family protein [bacterium]|nr:four-carbon acid sugar kinase family protein [bacterium]
MIISDMIGIIADDLTDAEETALQFHLMGANSQILLDFKSSPQNVKNTQVWAVSTATRNKPADFAYEEVKKATQLFLDNINLDYFFKKIDSALTGNIGVESLAMLETLGWDAAVIVPACPSENKITVGGYQLVKGQPIERTEYARDNLSPLYESHVPTMLKKQLGEENAELVASLDLQTIMKGAGPILQKLNNFVKEGKKIIIADAVSNVDIEQIVLAAKKSDLNFLPVGTASMAKLLGNVWIPQIENQKSEKFIPELPKLILSGTGTKTTIAQLEFLESSEEFDNKYFVELDMSTVLGGVNNDFAQKIIDKLGDNNIVVINASTLINNFDGFSDDSLNADMTKTKLLEHVSAFLAELTKMVVSEKEVVLITLGGETSYKCCTEINSNQLQIIDEVIPAVALTLDHKAQWIVSKSGHIGGEDSLIEILKYFDLHKL